MRTRILPVILVVIACLIIPASLFGQKKITDENLSLRQQMESELLNLQRNLHRSKSFAERSRSFEKSEKILNSLHKKGLRQAEKDEIYVDRVLAILSEIPHGTQFEASKCSDYKTNLMASFDPTVSDAETADPALKSGLQILQALCAKSN